MTRSLKKIALIVSLGTFASKLGGLLRQLIIAGAFGVSAAYDAYNYAYILPGFFLVLLGGINGPFHNAMVSVLSRKSKDESSYILSGITTIVSLFLIILTIILFLFAEQIITIIGPGLSEEIHIIAVQQLKIMSPITIIAGLVGLGFGSLNSRNQFLIPSISPLISSVTLIFFIGLFWLQSGNLNPSYEVNLKGGLLLASATLLGAVSQWIIQIPFLIKKGLLKIRIVWDYGHQGVRDVLKIILPATLSAGMLQINVYTDLFFASDILEAAAGLSYANFLIQAPLGIISNAIIIPLLPTLAKLVQADNKTLLVKRIHQALIFSSACMIPLSVIFITTGQPIVELFYQRGSFDSNAVYLVSKLLIAYGLGMPLYLCRDLFVRVFYALEDGQTPFKVSTLGIFMNGLFDWILVGGPSLTGRLFNFNFGVEGLVISTALVNFITCIILSVNLERNLSEIPLIKWIIDVSKLLISGLISGLGIWLLNNYIAWPEYPFSLIAQISICAILNFSVFSAIAIFLGIEEIKDLINIFFRKFYSSIK